MEPRVKLDLIDMPQASRKRPATPDPSRIVLICFSRVQLSVTPWTLARQPPLSMGFSRQEYWSGLPCPPPEDLPNPDLLHCKWILYRPRHQGSPGILEWVSYPFSRGSSPAPTPHPLPGDRICFSISNIKGRFFTAEPPGKSQVEHWVLE